MGGQPSVWVAQPSVGAAQPSVGVAKTCVETTFTNLYNEASSRHAEVTDARVTNFYDFNIQ